jgi:hypothetical protein
MNAKNICKKVPKIDLHG